MKIFNSFFKLHVYRLFCQVHAPLINTQNGKSLKFSIVDLKTGKHLGKTWDNLIY